MKAYTISQGKGRKLFVCCEQVCYLDMYVNNKWKSFKYGAIDNFIFTVLARTCFIRQYQTNTPHYFCKKTVPIVFRSSVASACVSKVLTPKLVSHVASASTKQLLSPLHRVVLTLPWHFSVTYSSIAVAFRSLMKCSGLMDLLL